MGVVYQGFQACTPRVVPLGFRILVRDPRRLHWVILGLFYGRIVETCWGYDIRGTTQESLRIGGSRASMRSPKGFLNHGDWAPGFSAGSYTWFSVSDGIVPIFSVFVLYTKKLFAWARNSSICSV